MRFTIATLLLFSLLAPHVYAYEFTEVMYDPLGSDSQREWVEVYGDPLSDITFVEDGNPHSVHYIQGSCTIDCVSIIADDATLFLSEYSLNSDVLLYDSTWASLRNTGEIIGLLQDGELVEELTYTLVDVSGHSLQLVDGIYESGVPTPGEIATSEAQVPEFSVFASLIILIIAGWFVFRNRSG